MEPRIFLCYEVGKEEYPPIPKTKFGLFLNKNKNDLRIIKNNYN